MVKTLHAALAPLLITGALCFLCVFEYPFGRLRPYLTCLYFLIGWTSYAYVAYYLFVHSTMDQEIIYVVNDSIILSCSFVSIIVSLFRFKELKPCLSALAIADDTLEALGTPKEYQRFYRWMIGVVIAWIVTMNLLNWLDIVTLNVEVDFAILSICIPIMRNIVVHINTLNGLILGTILGYVGSRFERLNKHIDDLLKKDAKLTGKRHTLILIRRKRVVETEECERRLWIIIGFALVALKIINKLDNRHLHLQLSQMSQQLNKVFSVQIALDMASQYAVLVQLFLDFYCLYVDDNKSTIDRVLENLNIYVWAAALTIKLILLNHICQTVSDKANETIRILLKLLNDDVDEKLREQIVQFTLQIKQREVKFSGMRLFYVGHKFICNFFTSLLTVSIIIIQFSGGSTVDTDTPASNKY